MNESEWNARLVVGREGMGDAWLSPTDTNITPECYLEEIIVVNLVQQNKDKCLCAAGRRCRGFNLEVIILLWTDGTCG